MCKGELGLTFPAVTRTVYMIHVVPGGYKRICLLKKRQGWAPQAGGQLGPGLRGVRLPGTHSGQRAFRPSGLQSSCRAPCLLSSFIRQTLPKPLLCVTPCSQQRGHRVGKVCPLGSYPLGRQTNKWARDF